MPIKFHKHIPEPLPLPPTTYSIDGLSLGDAKIIRDALNNYIRQDVIRINLPERDRIERIIRVINC